MFSAVVQGLSLLVVAGLTATLVPGVSNDRALLTALVAFFTLVAMLLFA